jgi:hypothetical protein
MSPYHALADSLVSPESVMMATPEIFGDSFPNALWNEIGWYQGLFDIQVLNPDRFKVMNFKIFDAGVAAGTR